MENQKDLKKALNDLFIEIAYALKIHKLMELITKLLKKL